MKAVEANADGLVGPTHSYAGLAPGNLASETNQGEVSNPRAAVLEGLAKMRRLADWGVPQFVLPPHERPLIPFLRGVGYGGSDADVLERAWKETPPLAAAARTAVRPSRPAAASWPGPAAPPRGGWRPRPD